MEQMSTFIFNLVNLGLLNVVKYHNKTIRYTIYPYLGCYIANFLLHKNYTCVDLLLLLFILSLALQDTSVGYVSSKKNMYFRYLFQNFFSDNQVLVENAFMFRHVPNALSVQVKFNMAKLNYSALNLYNSLNAEILFDNDTLN